VAAPWDISGGSYDNKSFSVGSQETLPLGLVLSEDGTKAYVSGQANGKIYQYTLSTAWDISTASYASKLLSVSGHKDLYFKLDGTKVFGLQNTSIYQYTLSTAWDISTGGGALSFYFGAQEPNAGGLAFSVDGTKAYVVGVNLTIYQYTLSTAWDISTASYASKSFSVGSQESDPRGVRLSSDGTKAYIIGNVGDSIYQYTLSTAWDISTASYASKSLYTGSQEPTADSLTFESSGNKVYIVGPTNDTIYQYTLFTPNTSPTAPTWQAPTNGSTQDVSSTLLLDWLFTDPDAGDTQSAYTLRRTIGAGITYYNGTTWQGTEDATTKIASATESHLLPTNWGATTDADHYYAVETWDAADAGPSPWSTELQIIPIDIITGTVTLSGTGSGVMLGTVTRLGIVSISGQGLLTVSGVTSPAISALLSGTGSLSVTGIIEKFGTLSSQGSGSLTITGVVSKLGIASIAGTGSQAISGTVTPAKRVDLTAAIHKIRMPTQKQLISRVDIFHARQDFHYMALAVTATETTPGNWTVSEYPGISTIRTNDLNGASFIFYGENIYVVSNALHAALAAAGYTVTG